MNTRLSLDDAVSKLYGKTLTPCPTPLTDWQLFVPYTVNSTHSIVYLKLLEVPAYLYTSEQICNKVIARFKDILHKVKLVFIERCFLSSYYLLIAEENLIPVSSLLKIKNEAGEKIEEDLIFDYIQFLDHLQNHPLSTCISFTSSEIGVDSNGKLILANYLMYFQDHSREEKEGQGEREREKQNSGSLLRRDSRRVLAELIMPNLQHLDIAVLYSTASQKYGPEMAKVVRTCMEPSFNFHEVSQLIGLIKKSRMDESFSATITDTAVEDCEKMQQNFMNDTCNTAAIQESLRKMKKQQLTIRRRKVVTFIVVFVIILIGIGAVTFKYLTPRPLECDENQYPDQGSMKCLSCDGSCEKCIGAGNTMCVSCKGNLYLIIHDSHDKTGTCSQVCHGTIIKTKTCIDSH